MLALPGHAGRELTRHAGHRCCATLPRGSSRLTITNADGWSELRKSKKDLVLRVFAGDAAALAEAAAAERASLEASDGAAAEKAAAEGRKAAKAMKAVAAADGGAAGGASADEPKPKRAKKKLQLP